MAFIGKQTGMGVVNGVSNPLKDNPPIVSFNFVLRVEGLWDIACKSIKIERKENEFDLIQEGGLNDYPHRVRKQITRMFTLRIEQYVGAGFMDPLSLGTKLVVPLLLSVGRYTNPAFFLPDRQYIFTGCEVTAKEPGELQSERSGLLTESTTIAYESMFTIDTPFDSIKKSWEFDGFKKEGKGEGSRRDPANTELTEAEMIARTMRWSMSKEHGDGSELRTEPSTSSRQNLYLNAAETSKKDMADKSKLWMFDEKDAANVQPVKNFRGRGDSSRQNMSLNMFDTHIDEMTENAALWQFNPEDESVLELQSKSTEGIGKKSRQDYPDGTKITKNKSRNESIEGTHRWDFDPSDRNSIDPKKHEKGIGFSSRQNIKEDEKTSYGYDTPTETMRQNAKEWKFDEKDKNNKGYEYINHKGTGEESRQNKGMVPPETPRGTMINLAAQHEWKFDEKDVNNTGLQHINKKGNEKGSAQKGGLTENTRDDMAKLTSRWSFDPADESNPTPNKNKEGKGNASRQNNRGDYAGITELSKDKMKEMANLWPPKQSAQSIADFLSGGNK